jgi:periplasmic protein TonB
MNTALDLNLFPETPSKDKLWGMSLAVAAHIFVFAVGSIGLLQKVDYGMDASESVAEVDLIAAAPEEAPPVPAPAPLMEDKEDVLDPTKTQETAPTPPQPEEVAPTPQRAASGSVALASYYRNPPPRYPEEARKLHQEGRVMLEIAVTAEGRVNGVKLKESSGFPLLDQAAIEGVQNWKFRPARMGGLRIDTIVDVPVRFQLK